MQKVLLLSSSRVHNTGYLEHALAMIDQHLGAVRDVLFLPFAGVTISYDDYTAKVAAALAPLGINVTGIHQCADAKQAVQQAKAIMVGGGNTFRLLYELYRHEILELIKVRVERHSVPYVGWSAGSNVAGLTIRTTNDMPIIEPPSFNAMALFPFQINPHYTDYNPPGHNGETRQMRLEEFMVLDPNTHVVGIFEGSALQQVGNQLKLIGDKDAYLFKGGVKTTLVRNSDLSVLLNLASL